LSRSQAFKKRRLYAKLKNKKKIAKAAKPESKAPAKSPRFYPAYDVNTPYPSRRSKNRPTRIRASITPGTILILLAGKYRGRRVIFLKALDSGLLLVTGPYKINGVPMRRVNQAYVIATETKVDVSKVNVSDKLNDDYFKRPTVKRTKGGEDEFFTKTVAKTEVSDERKADQKAIDDQLVPIVKATPMLAHYLRARFSLNKSDRPHLMKF